MESMKRSGSDLVDYPPESRNPVAESPRNLADADSASNASGSSGSDAGHSGEHSASQRFVDSSTILWSKTFCRIPENAQPEQLCALPLQHLKLRLKKTVSESNAVEQKPAKAMIARPEPKPRRSIDPTPEAQHKPQQSVASNASSSDSASPPDPSPPPPQQPKTARIRHLPTEEVAESCGGASGNNELRARIRQLRHVEPHKEDSRSLNVAQ